MEAMIQHSRRLFSTHRRLAVRLAVGGIWVAGIAILVWLAYRYQEEIIPYLADADYAFLALSTLGNLLSILFATLGWMLLLRSFGARLNFSTHFKVYAVTLASRRLPGTLWYVGGRVLLYHRLGVSRTLVSLASGLELFIFAMSGGLVGFLLLFPRLDLSRFSTAFLGLALVAGVLFLAPNLVSWGYRLLKRPLTRKVSPLSFLTWLPPYALGWLSGGLNVAFTLRAFHADMEGQLGYILGSWALSGALGTLTFFLPSSFGVSEVSLAFFLSQIIPVPLAGTVAIIIRLVGIAFEFALAAILYPWIRGFGREFPTEAGDGEEKVPDNPG